MSKTISNFTRPYIRVKVKPRPASTYRARRRNAARIARIVELKNAIELDMMNFKRKKAP